MLSFPRAGISYEGLGFHAPDLRDGPSRQFHCEVIFFVVNQNLFANDVITQTPRKSSCEL